MTERFGIAGGYGATGRVVASMLWTSCGGDILVGGRDLARAQALASEFEGRVSATHLDALDTRSLDDFCGRCSIVVNCAGPVSVLQDRIAQAAVRRHCHYIDVAGSFVKERLLPRNREIEEHQLSFVLSAGWIPGMSELVPLFAHGRARLAMDNVESLTVYFGDSGEWSDNAFRDIVWYLRRLGLSGPNYFRRGEKVRARMTDAFPVVDLGSPVGLRRFNLFSIPELSDLARRLKDCNFLTYSYVPGLRAAMTAALVAVLPLPGGSSFRLLRKALSSTDLPVGGFVVAMAVGNSQGRDRNLTVQIVYEKQRGYWINGLVTATVARMIAAGKGVLPGVHFLADAVDPSAFLSELRESGIEQVEIIH